MSLRRRGPRTGDERPGRRRRKPRGYLLLEQLMAGGILAATIATTYGVISQARGNIIRSSKRQLAVSVAKAQVEQLAAAPHVVAASTAFTVPGEPNISGTYEVVRSNLELSSTPNLRDADALHEIVVTVTYPDINGVPTTMTLRRYRRR